MDLYPDVEVNIPELQVANGTSLFSPSGALLFPALAVKRC
jgi:hypothetical protein